MLQNKKYMTTTIYDLINERVNNIVQALQEEDSEALYNLAQASQTEEERDELMAYVCRIDNNNWGYDRSINN